MQHGYWTIWKSGGSLEEKEKSTGSLWFQEGTAVNIEGKWRKVSDTQYFYIKYKGLEVDVVANDYIPIIGTNIPQFFNPHARLEVVDLNGVKQVLHLQDINWQDVVYWKFF